MSFYVMVTADFPNVDSADRKKIYECLEGKNWKKVSDVGRDISTVWYASFEEGIPYDDAIRTSKEQFINCSKEYTTPKLAIHAGPDKPTIVTEELEKGVW